jgi:hypothetical protein
MQSVEGYCGAQAQPGVLRICRDPMQYGAVAAEALRKPAGRRGGDDIVSVRYQPYTLRSIGCIADHLTGKIGLTRPAFEGGIHKPVPSAFISAAKRPYGEGFGNDRCHQVEQVGAAHDQLG